MAEKEVRFEPKTARAIGVGLLVFEALYVSSLLWDVPMDTSKFTPGMKILGTALAIPICIVAVNFLFGQYDKK